MVFLKQVKTQSRQATVTLEADPETAEIGEEKLLRLINPDPRLAIALAKRTPILVPERVYSWGYSWVADVGSIMRSRSYIASTIALYASIGLMSALLRKLPDVTLLDMFLKKAGFRE